FDEGYQIATMRLVASSHDFDVLLWIGGYPRLRKRIWNQVAPPFSSEARHSINHEVVKSDANGLPVSGYIRGAGIGFPEGALNQIQQASLPAILSIVVVIVV